jgi:O-antigen/teichoic acid export membrane protein
MLVAVASGSVDTVVLMSGRSWLSLGNTIAALVVNIGLNLFLIPRWGVLGAGVAWAVAIIVRNALPLIQVRRSMGMSPFGPGSLRVAVVSVACFAVVPGALALVGVSQWLVLAALLLGGVVYAYLLWRSRRLLQLDHMLAALRRKSPGRKSPSRRSHSRKGLARKGKS